MTNLTLKHDSSPWYKQRWPWILMAGPAIVVVAGLITAFLAVKSWDGLVADDYYKQGLGVNQVKVRDQHAAEAGLSVQINYSGKQVQAFLQGEGASVTQDKLLLKLIHPTRKGEDQTVVLTRQGAGFYRGSFEMEPVGRFNATLEDEKGDWRLTGVWKTATTDEPILLKPLGAASN